MTRRATINNSFSKGVLDPDLSERNDLKHYYQSLADGLNLEVKPQGGVVRRAGTLVNSDADIQALGLLARTRRRLYPLYIAPAQVTLHNGGTAANLVDESNRTLFTTSAVAGDPFVVFEIDLLTPQAIAAVDVIGFFAETSPRDNALALQYYDGAAWVEFRGSRDPGHAASKDIRTCGFKAPQTVTLATTAHVKLSGSQVVDGVAAAAGDTVLVKNHADPAKNGVYVVAAGAWARAASADTAAKILNASYAVTSGTANGGTTWYNLQTSLTQLNQFDTKSIVTYAMVTAVGRTRRFAGWPGENILARYWRCVVTGGAGPGAISVGRVRFWKESKQCSPVREIVIDRAADTIYDLILTERNVDVFKRSPSGSRRYVASVPVPVAAHQIDDVSIHTSRDTVLLFHEDIPSVRIVRQGDDTEWNADTLPAYDVPRLRAGSSPGASQDEKQQIVFRNIIPGEQLRLFLGDDCTWGITHTTPWNLKTDIASALQALLGASSPPWVTLEASDPVTIKIVFAGGALSQRAWPALQAVMIADTPTATPEHTILSPGLAATGPFFGARTGWPRCGAFVQGRLLVAGFRASPHSWAVSQIDSWSFLDDPGSGDDVSNPPPLTADMGFFRTLDTDQVETIQQVFVGRHLQLFTDSSEWFVEARTLDATQPANAVRATGVGIEASARVSLAEGATIIVQQGGRTVRDFLYNDVEQSYKAEPLSLLAPHLFSAIVDVGYRKALSTDDANILYFVNESGDMVALSLLRAQEVIACVPHQTPDGAYRSVGAHANGDVVFIVERTINGQTDNWVEMRNESIPLDAAMLATSPAPMTTVSGLTHLIGKEVWAYAGDQLCGPFIVSPSGTITLAAEDAATQVYAGLAPQVEGALQKVREQFGQEQPFRLPGRIYEVGLSLKRTGQIEISANGGPWRDVALTFHNGSPVDAGQSDGEDYAPDLPLLQRLYTGDVAIGNLRGWSRHPRLRFRQSVPAPLHIKAIRLEIAGK